MNQENITLAIRQLFYRLPTVVRNVMFRLKSKTNYLHFRLTSNYNVNQKINNPSKTYWINPKRITKWISPKNQKGIFTSEKIRGKNVGGNWDLRNYEVITKTEFYKAFSKRVKEGINWQDTKYYQQLLSQIETGNHLNGIENKNDLDEHCKYLDSFYEKIKTELYDLNRDCYKQNFPFSEIDVNIGRNGEYVLRDGIHRLVIAKLLEIPNIPIRVFARHQEWYDFKNFLFFYANNAEGYLYQSPVHPDLCDIPHYGGQKKIWKVIKPQLKKQNGVMLDIGSNLGFFCYMFEDMGYCCYAVEHDSQVCEIMEKIKIAENKTFQIINQSIFDIPSVTSKSFDVVLALNIFHHFLKTKTTYVQLVSFLKKLKMNEMYFSSANFDDDQMKDSFINFSPIEFVNFIIQHSSLSKSELLYTSKSGRKLYKLYA